MPPCRNPNKTSERRMTHTTPSFADRVLPSLLPVAPGPAAASLQHPAQHQSAAVLATFREIFLRACMVDRRAEHDRWRRPATLPPQRAGCCVRQVYRPRAASRDWLLLQPGPMTARTAPWAAP